MVGSAITEEPIPGIILTSPNLEPRGGVCPEKHLEGTDIGLFLCGAQETDSVILAGQKMTGPAR